MEVYNDVEMKDKTGNNKTDKLDINKKFKKLQLKEKLLAKLKGNQILAKLTGISTISIMNLIKKENEIKYANNLFKSSLHQGGKPKY